MELLSPKVQKNLVFVLGVGLSVPGSALAGVVADPTAASRKNPTALPAADYSLNASANVSGAAPAALQSGLANAQPTYPTLLPGLNILRQQSIAAPAALESIGIDSEAPAPYSPVRTASSANPTRTDKTPSPTVPSPASSPSSRALLSQLEQQPAQVGQAFDGFGRMGLMPGDLKLPEGITVDHFPQTPETLGVPASAWRRDHRTQPGSLIKRFILAPLGLAEQPARLTGDPQSALGVETALLNWVRANPLQFENISPSSLRALSAHKVAGLAGRPDMVYVSFQQTIDGVPVEGSYLNFSVKLIGGRSVIARSVAQLYPDLHIQNITHLKEEEVLAKVAERLGVTPDQAKLLRMGRRIMHIDDQWRLIDFFRGPNGLLGAVNLQNGSSFVWDARMKLTEGKAQGRGVLFDPRKTGDNLTPLALGFLEIETSQGRKFYSDSEGHFTVEGLGNQPITVTARLKGKYAEVHNTAGKDLEVHVSARPGERMQVLFNPVGHEEFDVAQVNAYHHATQTHEFLKSHGVAHEGIERAISIKTNADEECNSFTDIISIFGFRSSQDCINSSYDTVVSHEYSHIWHRTATNRITDSMDRILHSMLSRMANEDPGEGWADIPAMFRTGQPLVGEGFFKDKRENNYIRDGNNKYQYNPKDERHTLGQAWMGFAWKLREALIRSLGEAEGAALASALVLPLVFTGINDIPELIRQVLLRDTDENGVAPHRDLIQRAAQDHGMEIEAHSPNKRRRGEADVAPNFRQRSMIGLLRGLF